VNARANAAARKALRQRSATTRARAAIARRGEASLTRHAIAAGLPLGEARSMAGSLKRNAEKLGVEGHAVRLKATRAPRRDTSTRYTRDQVRMTAMQYRPRKPEFKTARDFLLTF
jgi:hypothetical protein